MRQSPEEIPHGSTFQDLGKRLSLGSRVMLPFAASVADETPLTKPRPCHIISNFLKKHLAGAEGFENEPLMLEDQLKSLISSVPNDLGRLRP